MRIQTPSILLVGTLLIASFSHAAEPARGGFKENYSGLIEHNIFMRDRAKRPVEASTRPSNPAPQRSAEQKFVLTGVVVEAGGKRAYLEDRSTGSLVKVGVGEPIARGVLSQIDIDAVAYELGGLETWIYVGSDLTGSTASAPTTAPAAGASVGPGAAPVDPNSPNLSAAERMRLRRAQEQKKP